MEIQQDIVDASFEGNRPEDLLNDLIGEIKLRNYRVTRINNIDNIFERKIQPPFSLGFSYYKIVELCNLDSCSQIISSDLLGGVFMPVRFLVFQRFKETNVHLAFLRPTAFARLFKSREMLQLAMKLEEDMFEMMEEIGD